MIKVTADYAAREKIIQLVFAACSRNDTKLYREEYLFWSPFEKRVPNTDHANVRLEVKLAERKIEWYTFQESHHNGDHYDCKYGELEWNVLHEPDVQEALLRRLADLERVEFEKQEQQDKEAAIEKRLWRKITQ